jgi:hypothetical protein
MRFAGRLEAGAAGSGWKKTQEHSPFVPQGKQGWLCHSRNPRGRPRKIIRGARNARKACLRLAGLPAFWTEEKPKGAGIRHALRWPAGSRRYGERIEENPRAQPRMAVPQGEKPKKKAAGFAESEGIG